MTQPGWAEYEIVPLKYGISGEEIDVSQLPFEVAFVNLKDSHLVPTSQWHQQIRKVFRTAVEQQDGKVLLLPVQIQAMGYTRALRHYFSLQLQRLFTEADYQLVANQTLLADAFKFSRNFSSEEIEQLAEAAGADMIVEPYVGNYPTGRGMRDMIVSLRVWEKDSSEAWVKNARTSPVFSAAEGVRTPMETFNGFIPQIKYWLAPRHNWQPHKVTAQPLKTRPLDFGNTDFTNPLEEAIYLQLLGSLTPRMAEDLRQNYFIRSLDLLERTNALHEDYNHLKARALREVLSVSNASTLLQNSTHPADQCYLAYLQANLTGHQGCAADHEHPALQFISSLETLRMATAFHRDDVENPTVAQLVELAEQVGNDWLPATLAFAQSMDLWRRADNDWVKRALDDQFPLPQYTQATVEARALLGEDPSDEARIAPVKHFQKMLTDVPADKLLAGHGDSVSEFDHLQFLTAHGVDTLLKAAERMTDYQALPEQAIEYLRQWEAQMQGHPRYAALQASAYWSASEDAPKDRIEHLQSRAVEMGQLAYVWSEGMSNAAHTGQTRAGWASSNNRFPYLWHYDLPSGMVHTRNFYNLEFHLYEQNAERKLRRNEPLGELEDQFNGYHRKDTLLLKVTHEKGDEEAAAEIAKRLIEQKPDIFEPYEILAEQYRRAGNFAEAGEVLRKFPVFTGEDRKEPVKNSHRAGKAADDFLWAGQTELANEFYRIATEIGSGSGSDIIGRMRMAQAEQNLEQMAGLAQYSAQRYPSSRSLRDYLGLLVNFGMAEEVLSVFDEVYAQHQDLRTWVPAMVAQRALEFSDSDIADWLNRENFTGNTKHNVLRMQQMVRSVTTDRIPSMQAVELVEAIDGLYMKHDEGHMASSRFLNESFVKHDINITKAKAGDRFAYVSMDYKGKGHFVESRNKRVVHANRLAKLGEFSEAEKILDNLHAEFTLILEPHALPLFAYVKGRLGKPDEVRQILKPISPRSQKVEYELALVLAEGLTGNKEQAIKHMDKALGFAAGNTKTPMFRTFAVGQTLYWLWEATGEEVYRQRGLAWAKNRQVAEFFHAWPYALEAVLTNNNNDQLRASKKALYLDPQSHWMKSVPESVLQT
ncbi:MAG: hypothetical protein AAF993_18545 [Pseudomonadota bacterium]